MKVITRYESEDGRMFRSEAECLEYEQQREDARAASDMLNNGSTLMAALTRANQTRPWWDSGLTLEDKASLMRITKDDGFLLGNWQYRDRPYYKVHSIDVDGKVGLFRDSGSRMGAHGLFVGLRELLRYAQETALIRLNLIPHFTNE